MGRACAKQWGAHVQSNGLRMCKAMACAWRWLYLLANTSAPLKDQSLMLSLSCMDMVSPDKLSRLLLSMKPVQLNNLSASVLVAKTQRYFLASLHRLGNCGLLGLKRVLPLVQSFLRKVLSLTSLLITFRSFHRRPKAVAKGRRLSSTLEFVLLMKPKDSLFQLGNLDWIAAVRFQQLLQGSHQRKDN